MIRKIANRIFSWLAAAFITALFGSIFSSQRVIGALADEGANISFSERLSMTIYDVTHFGTLYFIFIGLAFAVAFLAGGGVFKVAKFGRLIIYTVAGAIAIWVMLWAMEQVFFGVPIVAGARDTFGLLLQILAGGIGGLLFARLSRSRV